MGGGRLGKTGNGRWVRAGQARERRAFSPPARGLTHAGFPFVNGMQNAIMTPFKCLVWRALASRLRPGTRKAVRPAFCPFLSIPTRPLPPFPLPDPRCA